MAHPENEEFQLYFSRIRPIFHQLFNLAHAITGNCDQAEYALQFAMLDCWGAGETAASRHSFREGLRSGIVRAALKTSGQGEFDWNGLGADIESEDPILHAIAQESIEAQRILALRHGCGLNPRRIAKLTSSETERVRTLLRRFDARTRRKMPPEDRRRYERLISRAVRSLLSQPSAQAPEIGSIFRTFQADAAEVDPPSKLPARILRMISMVILALFCIMAFWLCAVFLQPAVLEDPARQAPIMYTQENL